MGEAAAGGANLVVAAGGDGTLNEVVNGLDDVVRGGGAPRELPRLGILPMGTGNDLAAALGIPDDLAAAIDTAVHGRARDVDLARVEDRCFINVSTGGIGAEATEETSPRTSARWGRSRTSSPGRGSS